MKAMLLMFAIVLSACTSSPKAVSAMEACQEALDARCMAVRDCGGDKATCEANNDCANEQGTFPADQLNACLDVIMAHGCMGTTPTFGSGFSACNKP